MIRLILADNQAIFRAGAARVLALEDDMRIAAQCEDGEKLLAAVERGRWPQRKSGGRGNAVAEKTLVVKSEARVTVPR